jgi:hypothetical protein
MSQGLTFAEWFSGHYLRPGESASRGIARLQSEADLAYTTVYYALRGARVQPGSARKIEEFTGGLVDATTLVMAPTRAEIVESQRKVG